MNLTNEQFLQLLGQKEIEMHALKVQFQQALQQIQELTDENVKLRNEVKNGE